MTEFEWIISLLTAMTVLVVPAIAILIRGAIKWNGVEQQLEHLVSRVSELVMDQDKTHESILERMSNEQIDNSRTHRAILEQMRLDRDATDKRLRFIEEFWINQGRRS